MKQSTGNLKEIKEIEKTIKNTDKILDLAHQIFEENHTQKELNRLTRKLENIK